MNKIKEFDKIVSEMRKTFIAKNKDYGDDNIRLLGENGVYVRMWDKISRLKQLVWNNQKNAVKDESVEDTYKDLANYAIIGLIFRRGKWI